MNQTNQIHKCYYCGSENTVAIKEEITFLPSGPDTSFLNKCQDCKAGEAITQEEFEARN